MDLRAGDERWWRRMRCMREWLILGAELCDEAMRPCLRGVLLSQAAHCIVAHDTGGDVGSNGGCKDNDDRAAAVFVMANGASTSPQPINT
jgi:hypothetical protein